MERRSLFFIFTRIFLLYQSCLFSLQCQLSFGEKISWLKEFSSPQLSVVGAVERLSRGVTQSDHSPAARRVDCPWSNIFKVFREKQLSNQSSITHGGGGGGGGGKNKRNKCISKLLQTFIVNTPAL